MTDGPNNTEAVLSRLAGKWQVPLVAFGVIACGAALAAVLLSGEQFDWDREFRRLDQMVRTTTDGNYTEAHEGVRALLAVSKTPKTETDRRGRVRELLAEIVWRNIRENGWDQDRNWEMLREHHIVALRYGRPKTAEVVRRLAEAEAALGNLGEAVSRFKEAAAMDSSLANAMYRRVIELRRNMPEVPDAERIEELATYLESENADVEQFALALDDSVTLMLGNDRYDQASRLIATQLTRGLGGAYDNHLLFQRARVQAARGLTRQADDMLIRLAETVEPATKLYPRVLLLRGQLIWDENPNEALTLFQEILARAVNTPLAVAARVGAARAYGQMRLYENSLGEYGRVLEALRVQRDNPYVEPAKLREGLIANYDALLADGRVETALEFAKLERTLAALPSVNLDDAEMVKLLGRLTAGHMAVADTLEAAHAEAVASLADQQQVTDLQVRLRANLESAGEALLEMASLSSLHDDDTHGDSLWTAAEAFDRAGLRRRSIETLQRFVAGRPADERIAEARFRLGQALQAAGRYDEAIKAYKDNLATREPASRHLKAVEGLIPMAQCYIAKGPEYFDEAETILQDVAGGHEGITPESALYRQALYGLGRLYYIQGKWRQTRRTLIEAVQRDDGAPASANRPDPQGLRRRYIRATWSKYFIAKTYQHTAGELRQQSVDEPSPTRRQMRDAAEAQLAKAVDLHREVIDRLEVLDGDLERTERALRKTSYFDLADCLFELGLYEDALAQYKRAVFTFQRTPEALGALVAIYNCHIALGRPDQAGAAMEQARELRKHVQWKDKDLPVEQPSAQQWDRWWNTVAYLEPDVSSED